VRYESHKEFAALNTVTTVDQLLQDLQQGDVTAGDRIFTLLYDDFKGKAHLILRSGGRQTLCTTELVNETWLRLRGQFHSVTTRLHYCNLAARAMRQVLVDRARSRSADKRGAGELPLSLQELDAVAGDNPYEVLLLDQVMHVLDKVDTSLSQLAQLHLFAGLSIAEIATLQGANERTVFRKWRTARMALLQLMSDQASPVADDLSQNDHT
jgi:RNA polymerase sigma factor (TIGR02999 family)